MPKKQTVNGGMPDGQRKEAVALITAIRSGNHVEQRKAAHRLLETALYFTQLVEWAWYLERDAIREMSKNYPRFPILLSGRGHDAQQKLNRIEALPIAENTPFKRIRGAARCDDIRTWIESAYEVFEHVQSGSLHSVDPISPALVETIQSLPELSKASARLWAATMVKKNLEGRGGDTFIRAIGIDTSKATQKRRQKKEVILRKRFGGTRVRAVERGSVTHFFAGAKELDFKEATRLEQRMRDAHMMNETAADRKEALVDAVEKRLISILK